MLIVSSNVSSSVSEVRLNEKESSSGPVVSATYTSTAEAELDGIGSSAKSTISKTPSSVIARNVSLGVLASSKMALMAFRSLVPMYIVSMGSSVLLEYEYSGSSPWLRV